MAGIRLHHPTLRNATIAVECKRGYRQPFQCPLCNTVHLYKTVHLTLDNEGDVIVSQGVWNKDLKNHPNLPVSVENEVEKPPALVIGGPDTDRVAQEILAHPYEGRR